MFLINSKKIYLEHFSYLVMTVELCWVEDTAAGQNTEHFSYLVMTVELCWVEDTAAGQNTEHFSAG